MRKFRIYLDVGVANTLAKRGHVEPGSELFGRAFEHFIFLELRAYLDYRRIDQPLTYWRCQSQFEVDFIIGDTIGIEATGASCGDISASPLAWGDCLLMQPDLLATAAQDGIPREKEASMSESTKAATSSYAEADPKLYAFLDWMEQQDPDYAKAFRAYGEKGTGEGQALPIKYREMVMSAILVFSGRREGAVAHLKRAIEHGATKRELFEAGQSAAIPGGGITLGLWMQILTKLDSEGAFKNG